MIRQRAVLAALAMLVVPPVAGTARADGPRDISAGLDDRQVALAGDVGLSGGGTGTPGGLRVGGHYLYRLADRDWFDTSVAFTFGGRGDACMPGSADASGATAMDALPCDRAVTDGFAGDLALGLRRELAVRHGFTPWLRIAGFARALRFTDVGGFAAGGELGAGLRAPVHGDLAIVAGATGFLGVPLDADLASTHQLGLTITVGAEVGMR